jgi:hypothetical protein
MNKMISEILLSFLRIEFDSCDMLKVDKESIIILCCSRKQFAW